MIFNDAIKQLTSVKIGFWDTLMEKKVPLSNLRLLRPNHPNNCFTLDLSLLKDLNYSIQRIKFYFKQGTDALILMEDRLKSIKRPQKVSGLGNIGPELFVKNQSSIVYKYYAAKFHQNTFLESDPSKHCSNYPNSQHESYEDCDDKFVRKFLETYFPDGFLPVWATDDSVNVTQRINLNGQVDEFQLKRYQYLYDGSTQSDCLSPCKSTEIRTDYIDEKVKSSGFSKIEIGFSSIVSTSTTNFPKFHLETFVSSLGGLMGLWLGPGVVQVLALFTRLVSAGRLRIDQY